MAEEILVEEDARGLGANSCAASRHTAVQRESHPLES